MPPNDPKNVATRKRDLDEWPRYDISLKTVYVVLGFLDEYLGRTIIFGSDDLEHFYPGEVAVAETFEMYLRRLQQEYGLSAPLKRKTNEQGHIYFLSREIGEIIDGFYTVDLDADRRKALLESGEQLYLRGLPYEAFKPIASAHMTPKEYNPRFSFLLGAYLRYGKDRTFVFANSSSKADLIRKLLSQIGCHYVGLKGWYGGAPARHVVEFEPTPDLNVLFGLPECQVTPVP